MKNLKFEISYAGKMVVNEQIYVITILLNVAEVTGECTIKEISYIGGIPLTTFNHYNGILLLKKATEYERYTHRNMASRNKCTGGS